MLKNIVDKLCKEIDHSVVHLLSKHGALTTTHQQAFAQLRDFLTDSSDGRNIFTLIDVMVYCYIHGKVPESTQHLPDLVIEEISKQLRKDSAAAAAASAALAAAASKASVKVQVAQKIMRTLRKFLLHIMKEHHRVMVRIPKSRKDIPYAKQCLHLLLIEYVYRHYYHAYFGKSSLDKNALKSMYLDSNFKKLMDDLDKEVCFDLIGYLQLLKRK